MTPMEAEPGSATMCAPIRPVRHGGRRQPRRRKMKVSEVMTTRPLCVGPHESAAELRRLMDAARVHHLPLVEDGRLVGLWLATDEGPMVLLSKDRAREMGPDQDALEAVEALLGGSEAVVIWEGGETPAGLMTRSDVMTMVRSALHRGMAPRHLRPVVLRLVGPACAGKSTLMLRTLELLRRCEVAVVQANATAKESEATRTLGGTRVLDAGDAHWRKGFERCVDLLGDAQLIIVEDRDGPPQVGAGLGEDLQVIVAPPEALDGISVESLQNAQAVVITKMDLAPDDFDLARRVEAMRAHAPHLPVFAVAATHDDRGLQAWQHWLEARVLSRQH
jgi:Ni2+-binding GTPase involved in maturation of urease and hydrogenase/CBS domain-containing protein